MAKVLIKKSGSYGGREYEAGKVYDIVNPVDWNLIVPKYGLPYTPVEVDTPVFVSEKDKKKKILVCVGDGIGNMLQGIPLAYACYLMNAEVDILLDPNKYANKHDVKKIFERINFVNKVYLKNSFTGKGYDHVLVTWWARGCCNMFDNPLFLGQPDFLKKNEIEFNMELARKIGWNGDTPFGFKFNIEANSKYKGYIAVHVGCTPTEVWRKKRVWDKFNELIKRLKYNVVLIGSKWDRDIKINKKEGMVDLRGKNFSLIKTAEVIKASRYMISCDSGMMHLGNKLHKTVYSIWGGTSWYKSLSKNRYSIPIYKGLSCQPCQYLSDWDTCSESRCLTELTVDDVMKVLEDKKIVVGMCTYNRSTMCKKAISSLLCYSKGHNISVFVYDDCSKKPFVCNRKNVYVFRSKKKSETSGQRKKELIQLIVQKFPSVKYLYLTDDDFFYSKGWLTKLLGIFNDEKFSKVPVGIITGFTHPFEFKKYKHTKNMDRLVYYPHAASGGSMLIPLEVIRRVMNTEFWTTIQNHNGMFDFHLSTEVRRLGYKIVSTIYSIVFHEGRKSVLRNGGVYISGVDKDGNYEYKGDSLPISVITLICGDFDYWCDCIKSLSEKKIEELILIWNGVGDRTEVENFETDKFLKVIKIYNEKNRGFTKAVVQGMKRATQPYMLWLSPDVVFRSQGTIERVMNDLVADKKAGIGGCIMYSDSRRLHYIGGFWVKSEKKIYKMWKRGDLGEDVRGLAVQIERDREIKIEWDEVRETEWITGAFFMIKRELVDEIGYPDEQYFFFKSDGLYCLEARTNGWKCIISPVSIIHLVGKSGYPFTVNREE